MLRNWISIAAAAALSATAYGAIAATPSGITEPARVIMTVDGPVLHTPEGFSLYRNNNEDLGSPKFAWQCTNVAQRTTNDQQSGLGPRPEIGFKLIKSCLDKFKPYLAPADAVATGDFTITKRPDGTSHWAYQGFPLYTSARDKVPYERNGVGGGFFNPRQRGMIFATSTVQLPVGLKMMRRAEGLMLVSSDTERPVFTYQGGARFQQAAFGREDFKPILAPAVAQLSGDWSVMTDSTGSTQLAFKGKPLYTAAASLNDIEITKARGWEPVVLVKAPALPRSVGTKLTLLGDVFTDSKGMTLYTYNCNVGFFNGRTACDDKGDPAAFMVALCGDGAECARRWKPYRAPANAKREGEFSVIDITYPMFTDMRGELYPADAPSVKVWAYRGKPLFTYYEDEKPGDIWGDGVGGIWGSQFGAAQVPGRTATFFEP